MPSECEDGRRILQTPGQCSEVLRGITSSMSTNNITAVKTHPQRRLTNVYTSKEEYITLS